MGANEGRHVYDMLEDLARVIALELMTNAQAMELRYMILQGEYLGETRTEEPDEVQAHRQMVKELQYQPSPKGLEIFDNLRKQIAFEL